jgi:hypothetical protein
MDRTVTVWGKPYTVQVSQRSRISWVASAVYFGEIIVGHGPTAQGALVKWATAAKSRGQKRA